MIGYLRSDVMPQPVSQGMMGSAERLSPKVTEDAGQDVEEGGARSWTANHRPAGCCG